MGLHRGGLFVRESGRFDPVGGSDGLEVQNFISSAQAARDGVVWAGTLGDGLYGMKDGREVHYTTANGLADDNVLAVCSDADAGIWVSTGAGTIHHFAGQSMIPSDAMEAPMGTPVTTMIPAAGGLWLGTQDGQILRWENEKFTVVEESKNLGNFPILVLNEG